MCYYTKHVFALAIAHAFLFTTHNYAAAQAHEHANAGNVNEQLRESIRAYDATTVRTLLQQNADPNYTPKPHIPTRTQRVLQKYWLINTYRHEILIGILGPLMAYKGEHNPFFVLGPIEVVLYGYVTFAMHVANMFNDCRASSKKQTNFAHTPPLILAAQLENSSEQSSIVHMLLTSKADINATDEHGDTALHHSERNDNQELKKLLIMAGADKTKRNDYGYQAIRYLPDYSDEEQQVAQLLNRIITHIRSLNTIEQKQTAFETINSALTTPCEAYRGLRLIQNNQVYPECSWDEFKNYAPAVAYRLNAHKQQILDASPIPPSNAIESTLAFQ